jgi:hypothetical protein
MATPKMTNEQCQEAADAMAACAGNQVQAAAKLGLSRATLQNRLRHAEDRGLVTHEDPTVVSACGDPGLRSYATARQLDVLVSVWEHGSVVKAAEDMRVSGAEIRRTVQAAQDRASLRGYSPEHGWNQSVPATHIAKGVSTYVDGDGKVKGQWIKADVRREAYVKAVMGAIDAHIDGLHMREVGPPVERDYSTDVIPWVNVGDAHIGMLAHAAETGESFDLKIGKRELMGAIDQLVEEMPPCERAVLNDLGDATHYENFAGVTEASGHVLDYDSRFPKMIDVYVDTMLYLVDKMLTKCRVLDVIINQGNHSRTNDIWMAKMIRRLYEHTGRVNVLRNESVFIGYRMGNTLVMVHHGDKCKPDKLPAVMANDFAKDWGETEFHYIDVGHFHHRRVAVDENGAVVESWNHLPPADKYAHDGGWRNGRSISVVLRSRSYGEIGRRTLGIKELRDRLLGVGHKVQTTKPAFVA